MSLTAFSKNFPQVGKYCYGAKQKIQSGSILQYYSCGLTKQMEGCPMRGERLVQSDLSVLENLAQAIFTNLQDTRKQFVAVTVC